MNCNVDDNLINLVKLRQENKDEYDKFMKDLELVFIDLARIMESISSKV